MTVKCLDCESTVDATVEGSFAGKDKTHNLGYSLMVVRCPFCKQLMILLTTDFDEEPLRVWPNEENSPAR